MSQESNNPAERRKAAKFGFFMLRGALYVGNALTVGLLCFAAQILFYMLCLLTAIALFILVAIVLPATFVIIGFLIECAELALFGIIVALIAWGVMLACAASANRGQRDPFGIDSCIENSIKPVGEYIMRPWEYVNQKIGTIGTENNQDQDNVNADTKKNGDNINLEAGPINDDGVASKIEDANQNNNKNDLKMSNNTKETINDEK
ncbi:MAG: hypothetical protein IJU86_00480 [Firmicutes bacterium]|nr:hypothetical protein [Bacillota bacterium]